jgi:hypothetical protein
MAAPWQDGSERLALLRGKRFRVIEGGKRTVEAFRTFGVM